MLTVNGSYFPAFISKFHQVDAFQQFRNIVLDTDVQE
jgi:hypothetical protein